MYIFNMFTVHLRRYMCQGVQYSHALSVENRPPNHPFGRDEAAGARRYPRLVVTQSGGLSRSRAQCNLPLLFRSLSTGSCASRRSCPATGIGAEEGGRRARAGCHNPRDVICLHKVRKGQPSPLRRDDESPRAGARCGLPPKPLDVHRRAGTTNCRARAELRRRLSRFGRSSMEPWRWKPLKCSARANLQAALDSGSRHWLMAVSTRGEPIEALRIKPTKMTANMKVSAPASSARRGK